MNNKKKIILPMIIGLLMVITVIGVTYAFFNYTRTGPANAIRVGRIYFNHEEGDSISLENVFPISSEQAETDTTNAKTLSISVIGDTDYDGGIEYVVTLDSINNSKNIPITLEVTVDGTGLGTEEPNDYYTNRNNYSESKYKIEYNNKLENNNHILVGYISPNVNKGNIEGINGTINIKAYVDNSNILISDTYPEGATTIDGVEYYNGTPTTNKIVLTTEEWNSITGTNALSFKIKVEAREGIWVREPVTLHQTITRQASTASYIANYDDIILANPTFTTQDQVSTSAPKQTVYYFTGSDAAANANVLFAGYCWQIIRTTDNGGIRLIYNGVAVNNKCETTRTATKGINGADSAWTSLSGASLFGRSYDYDLATGEFTIQDSTGLPTALNETNYKDLIGTYTCNSSSATCTTLYYVGSYASNTNAYTASYTIGDVAHFSQLGKSAFNPNYMSPALVGYMFNTEYDYKNGSKSGEYFTTVVWENGVYTLSNGNGGTTPDATHHYICDSDCTKVRYYYYVSSMYYYILLENGMTIEDALYQMVGTGSSETKTKTINANYELNNYNSAIKGYLDNWYKKNLTGYTSYLDETSVYCNDRSIIDLGGWNPSGTTLSGWLQFKQYSANGDLNCVNETDRFAVTNNKAKLTYPIGLLTEPERNLMTANFAKTGQGYWGASPYDFIDSFANVRYVKASGVNDPIRMSLNFGARGVVTLKPGTKLENGSGTYDNPYVVGPIVTRDES